MACLLLLGLVTAPAAAQPTLLENDRKILESLLTTVLFDPHGAQRVKFSSENTDGELKKALGGKYWRNSCTGWLVDTKAGRRIHFTDGASIPAPDMKYVTPIDFVALVREAYAKPRDRDDPESGAWTLGIPSDMVVAAWLYRLDQKELAGKVMAQIPEPRAAAVASLRKELAAHAFASSVAARQEWADEAARAHSERLFRLYAVEAKHLPQASRVLEDLKRRKQQGKFGQERPKKLPAKFDEWDKDKQLKFLLDSLEDVDFTMIRARMLRYRHTPIELDFRLQALIKLG